MKRPPLSPTRLSSRARGADYSAGSQLRRAGLIEEAAATFEEALTVTLSSDGSWKANRLFAMIRAFADSGRGA
jgi:hypothetical protein